MSEDVYVLGVDMIKFGRFPDRTVPNIGAEAALLALDDAGLTIKDMQAMYCGNLGQANAMVGQRILQEIGQTGIPVVNCANACATGATAFREAWMSIKAGIYDVVLAVGVEQMGKGLLGGAGGGDGIPKEGLLGSGTILREIIAAAEILSKEYNIDSDIWSVTSFNELRRDGMETERLNLLNPDKKPKKSYVQECLSKRDGPVIAASDYTRAFADQIRPYTDKKFYSFGTDGYGRSDTRKNLRKFFEIDKEHIVAFTLSALAKGQLVGSEEAEKAIKKYKIDKSKEFPANL